jgi:hypothetical protein
VKPQQLLRAYWSESHDTKQPQLALEPAGVDVEALLTRLSSLADPVVVEDDIRAAREELPFGARRLCTHARPER